MGCPPNRKERRIKERRSRRSDIKFPLTDDLGCIVLFDRTRIADRRLEKFTPKEEASITTSGNLLDGSAYAGDFPSLLTPATISDSTRNFYIAGELIASVNNFDNCQSPGRWKVLELYQTPNGQYVCLEIWRSTLAGMHDQYWLTTCDDLKSVHEFLGNSSLASELFDNVL